MKNRIATLCLLASLVGGLQAASAQSETGYFNQKYTYGYQLNPAFGNEKFFISLPALGNVNLSIQGNYGIKNVLYHIDGRTTTFLNPQVSASEMMSGLNADNRLDTHMKLGILAFGFNAFKGYNTVSINLVTNVQTDIPRDVFSLAKEGVKNTTYDISSLDLHADSYVELALNHSHKINDKWRVGGALKLLVGAGNLDAEFQRAQLTLGQDNWTAVTEATLRANIKGLYYKTKVNDRTGHEYVSDLDIDGAGIAGFGGAVDLGAQYKLNDDWTFSAAVLDLGAISWSNDVVASTNGVQTIETNRYTFNVDDEAVNSFDNELDQLKDDLSALYELNNNGDRGSRLKMLATTLRFGAEYSLPVYRKLTFGLLNTTRIQRRFTETNFRLSANIAPVKVLSLSLSGEMGTFGAGFGGLLNLHVPGFNFFVGMDHVMTKVAKQYVPLDSKAQVSFGVNIAI